MARLYVEPAPDPTGEATMVLGGQEFTYTDQDWNDYGEALDDAVEETLAAANRHLACAKALMAGARELIAKRPRLTRAAKVMVHVLVITVLGVLLNDLFDDGTINGDEVGTLTAVVSFCGLTLGHHAHLLIRMG